jgi:hypothetical protein
LAVDAEKKATDNQQINANTGFVGNSFVKAAQTK